MGSQEFLQDHTEEPYNDIVLKQEENSSEIGKRHFLIKYSKETTGYYLRDLGDGNGTFVRLDSSLVLKTGYIVSFGESHMYVQISSEYENQDKNELELRFLDGPKIDQSFTFNEDNKTIKIGRMNDCDIKFASKGLSR